ncbi:unnamed protein product [Rotaria sordida]|uniref:F-box domain-containing protein n=1 Tax=Rotaria sordida TaxID=392033 RepID=A0A819GZ89_9BILA|nr:unnamed protein product [Rotaria sordida]
MITKIETLPNEILLYIFSYLSWYDMLISFWSLNIRFDSLVCSILSINDRISNSGILITQGLSYNKCSSILFPLIINSSSLCSSIQRIHFDETNSIACDLIYQWLFNEKKILHFSNLKSLILTRCGSIKAVVQSLSYLIEHQLDELTLTFNQQGFRRVRYEKKDLQMISDAEIERRMNMIKELLCQLFSGQCQLKSLRLDISNILRGSIIHRCLKSRSYLSFNPIQHEFQSYCMTLRCLYIRLNQTCFLENLIEYVPNLEQLLVEFHYVSKFGSFEKSNVETLRQSNENWFNKIPKLRYFSLKTLICDDSEFVYLKWLLNNLNYIEKLQVHLRNNEFIKRESESIWKSVIDANFVRQYCLPSKIINLIYFNFYICSECQSSLNDIEKIINSFKIHSFFIEHQWTNVKYLFDPIMSCQHLFSLTDRLQFSDNPSNHSYIFNWPYIDKILFRLHPSFYLFLERFKELSPKISWIKVYKTRVDEPIDRNEIREKVLAHLISMTVQLKYLRVEQFEWLLHVVQYASNELRTNALNSVRYAEFCLPSCHYGFNKANHIGKCLVPFLSTYMPHLQTLRLWRPDDFPWTSIQHVVVFEQDLYQLVKKLKEFIFLDIYGEIHYEKVEPYRLMVQASFPNSRIDIGISRFRLWL